MKDESMCQIVLDMGEIVLGMRKCSSKDFTTKPMQGYVFIGDDGWRKAVCFFLNCLVSSFQI